MISLQQDSNQECSLNALQGQFLTDQSSEKKAD